MAAVTPISEEQDYGILPLDMTREVLLRVPARPVCRFRAVCRSWRELLSDPGFIAAHDHKPLVAVTTLVGGRGNNNNKQRIGTKVEFVLLDIESGNVVRRVGGGFWDSRQAKVHAEHHLAGITLESRCLRVRVVNLDSGAVSVVPRSLEIEQPRNRRTKATCVALVVGRSASGFHKAVRIRDSGDERRHQDQFCDVLTVDGGGRYSEWRERWMTQFPVFPGPGNAAVVNGVAFFLVYPRSRLSDYYEQFFDGEDGIAYFDLHREYWSYSSELLKGPLSSSSSCTDDDDMFDDKGNLRLRLAALNGHLVVAHFRNRNNCENLDLWFHDGTFPEDGRTLWCRRYTIRCTSIWQIQPLWELDDERLALWDNNHGVLRLYHPKTGDFVDVVKMNNTCVSASVYTGDMLLNH